MYIVKDVHPVSDTEAELRVLVLDIAGTERGEMIWSVVKDESHWKLKNAPLP